MQDAQYQEYIEKLGKGEDVRRWLMTMFLTTSYHVTTRPISEANTGFFNRMAYVNDRLFSLLKEPGWELLEPSIEYGFSLMEEMSSKTPDKATKYQMKVDFKRNYKRYFKGINPPWSSLTPTTDLSVSDWKNPKEILVAFGANSGIGDEFIYYRLIRRLKRAYPEAKISLISYQNTMWDLCPGIDNITYHKHDQLAPFMEALKVMERDKDNLVIFSEFASITIYRQLEGVEAFNRYVYMDTGMKMARIVDLESNRISEWSLPKAPTMYHVLDGLMDSIGLINDEIMREKSRPIREKDFILSEEKNIYLNPFTSKDYKAISPEWWVAALKEVAGYGKIRVEVFEGINEVSKNYARQIQDQIKGEEQIEIVYEEETPSIAETIEKAAASDLVFGIDTFTGHVGILETTPCFTVFLGSKWHLWKIPDNFVLNADADDDPEIVGRLVAMMLFPELEKRIAYADELIAITNAFIKHDYNGVDGLRALLQKGEALVREWVSVDPGVADFAMDVPEAYFNSLVKSLSGDHLDLTNKHAQYLLKRSFNTWLDCNLHRYCRYLLYLEKKATVAMM